MVYSESREHEALHDLVTRLTARFSDSYSPDQVEAVVMQCYEPFKASTVRDYIPVLVEHASKDRLWAKSA
ncbi:three-helix bundle dimerization domain-containing protein [Sphaerisporangium aureirubrum]|uniref:Three-helix bundle dimerization domain-containing protein n=1 Tax=Sphaerisporangium aureirubrum TaxID=1544736 RepID=A0ABW1NLF1_9ACTN